MEAGTANKPCWQESRRAHTRGKTICVCREKMQGRALNARGGIWMHAGTEAECIILSCSYLDLLLTSFWSRCPCCRHPQGLPLPATVALVPCSVFSCCPQRLMKSLHPKHKMHFQMVPLKAMRLAGTEERAPNRVRRGPGSNPSCVSYQLCDLGQVTSIL